MRRGEVRRQSAGGGGGGRGDHGGAVIDEKVEMIIFQCFDFVQAAEGDLQLAEETHEVVQIGGELLLRETQLLAVGLILKRLNGLNGEGGEL
jgi:hypothetical protein